MSDEVLFYGVDGDIRNENHSITELFQYQVVDGIEVKLGHPLAFPDVKGVYIKLDEKITKDKLKKALIEIFALRDDYYGKHGPSLGMVDPDFQVMRCSVWLDLLNINEDLLARYLNFEASVILIQNIESEPVDWKNEKSCLKSLFDSLSRGNDEERKNKYFEWLAIGKKRITNNKAPWKIDIEPFDAEKIREKVRYFERSIALGNHTFISEADIKSKTMSLLFNPLVEIGFFKEECDEINLVTSLLDKSYRDTWKEYKDGIYELMNSVSDSLQKRHPGLFSRNIKSLD